ncbi:MAG TPA: RNA-binding protein [Candidatus Caenarcaniphilales bacterium]
MSVRLYIGNLPKEVDRQELETFFAEGIGDIASTKVVTDHKTGKCRGFGFVTVETEEQADQVVEKFNGQTFKDSVLKIEKALPRTKTKEEVKTVSDEGGSNTSVNRRSGKSKARRSNTTPQTAAQSEAVQPDPRWAQELEKLKQMLSTQTSSH